MNAVTHDATADQTFERTLHPRRRRGWLIRRSLLAADVLGLSGAFLLAEWLHKAAIAAPGDRLNRTSEILLFAATLPIWVVLAKSYKLYDNDEERNDHSTVDEVRGIFHLVTVGTWVVLAASWVTSLAHPEFSKLFMFWLLAIVAVSMGRASARTMCRRHPSYVQNTVIVGAGQVGQTIARKLLNHPEYGVRVVGFVDADPQDRPAMLEHLPILGTSANLGAIVDQLDIERVILAFSNDSNEETLDLLRRTKNLNLQVDIVPRLFEVITPTSQMHSVEGLPLLSLPPMRLGRSDRLMKRGMDMLLTLPGLVVISPLLLAIAIAIKVDSPGPVFFRQWRVGERDRLFRIWKFRTMVPDADERKHEVAHLNDYLDSEDAPVMFKIADDPRTTRIGAFLRRTSLDELPQLINVVMGEMSLVGPRPLIPEEDRHVGAWGRLRLDLRPGITGLWQVLGRNDIPFEEMVQLDYQYVTTWSITGDVGIIWRTMRTVNAKSSSVTCD